MAELGMDYPRGAVLGWGKVTFSNMAVAGDSYSSGVGSLTSGQAYLAGSDTGTDECRRSPNAYGRVLDANPVVKLQMPAASFMACSGATTAAISTTASSYRYQTEVAQYRQVPSSTKVIFMTIGGNDVNFGRLGALCIFLDCSAAQYQQEFANNLAALQPKLQTAYAALLNRAPGATLYIMGYPHILPLQDCTDTGSGAWWFALQAQKVADPSGYATEAVNAGLTPAEAQQAALGSGPTISNSEAVYTNTFENNLNLTISNAVDAVNASYPGRVVYVSTTQPDSPLEGKQLCSASPDFNGLDGAQTQNTFHPNSAGQADMAQVAFAALAAHQPQYVVS
jgi:lysophospholipase L1-like esterase